MSAHQSVELLLTAVSPIAHQDAGVGDMGNTQTFNRRRQFVESAPVPPATAAEVAAFCAAHPAPAEVWEALRHASLPEYVAAALLRLLVDQYGGADGTGLFSGLERYEMLERRLQAAAIVHSTLQRLWGALGADLLLPIHPSALDADLLAFWALSPALQRGAIAACAEQPRVVVTLARVWASQAKLRQAEYAAAAGQTSFVGAPLVTPAFEVPTAVGAVRAAVPVISGNTVRHQLVRAPLRDHLVRRLGVPVAFAGQGALPLAVEAIFSNGGNIRAGAKQPTNVYALKGRARAAFPALDLLGGVADSFDLGESMLKVHAHLVCRENRRALPAALAETPAARTSAFEMLDQRTETRQATANGIGQMIRTFEVLAPGTEIYVRLALSPWATALTRGALVCALAEFEGGSPIIGGQSARGYGEVVVEHLDDLPSAGADAALYEAYLAERGEQMLLWLLDGTLGADKVICS